MNEKTEKGCASESRRAFLKTSTAALGAVASAPINRLAEAAASDSGSGRGACSRQPQPPPTEISLEGQNCIACFEQGPLVAERQDFNASKDCQNYATIRRLFQQPFAFPAIVDPSKLTYAPNPPWTFRPVRRLSSPPWFPSMTGLVSLVKMCW